MFLSVLPARRLPARRAALVDIVEQSSAQSSFRGLAAHRHEQQSLTLLSLSAAPPRRQAAGGPVQHLLATVLPTNAWSRHLLLGQHVPRTTVKTVTGRGQHDWMARPTEDSLHAGRYTALEQDKVLYTHPAWWPDCVPSSSGRLAQW